MSRFAVGRARAVELGHGIYGIVAGKRNFYGPCRGRARRLDSGAVFTRLSALIVWLRPGAAVVCLGVLGCRNPGFPATPAGYREYAYVANAGANTVSVLDLVYVRADRTLQVGAAPVALAASPTRNEVYVVNSGSASVSVIDADAGRVVATIGVGRGPLSIAVEAGGRRGYVVNAGSVSVVDLEQRRQIAEAAVAGEARAGTLSPDGRSLVVPLAGGVAVFAVDDRSARLRASFGGCAGAVAPVILPDSSKAFVACSGGRQVMALNLAAAAGSWAARQDGSLTTDRMLALLDVGANPVSLALKPDGGEIFVANGGSGSVSEIATTTNDVGSTSMIGNHPVRGLVSRDNTLYVANLGDDSIGLYSVDEGKIVSSLHTGAGPEAMSFSADEHLLLALDTRAGDVSVIRTQGRLGPNLFTILPAGSKPSAIVTKVVTAKAGN